MKAYPEHGKHHTRPFVINKKHRPRKANGWMIANRLKQAPFAPEPHAPAEFDVLLSALGIAEKDAPAHPKVKAWVQVHKHNRFVPCAVLRSLGMEEL